ncbi:chromatin assembly factor 1 subunit rlf2, partial [Podospora australis]
EENSPLNGLSAAKTASSPLANSPGLTDSGSSPLDRESPTPDTPTRVPTATSTNPTKGASASTTTTTTTATNEPPKKKRAVILTPEEKAAKAAAEEAKKKEREAAREEKAREQAIKAAEKVAKAAAEEQKKKEREAAKEEKLRAKREKEEEAKKKARSQRKLTGMFGITTQPKDTAAAAKAPTGNDAKGDIAKKVQQTEKSRYEKLFQPFFVKEHVKLAPAPYELDDETREAKTKILERYVDGSEMLESAKFDALDLLQIPYKVKRGRTYPSVKKIMAEFGNESQKAQARHAHELLKLVPLKSIKFSSDVRPPYIGTVSDVPAGQKSLKKLARKPISRQILPLAYDYDSEAEWQEEEGEDLDDLENEDEEGDVDEDMDDFLDDTEDVGPSRMVFSGGMEPESSGLCWENRKQSTCEPKMYKFRMEFIHEKLEHHHSIDPFSTEYWECPKLAKPTNETGNQKSKSKASQPSSASSSLLSVPTATPSGSSSKELNANPDPSSPGVTDAFKAIGPGSTAPLKKSQQRMPSELEEKLKALVRSKPKLSKVGVIELFTSENACVKAQLKNSFDALIVKDGKGNKVKGE